MTTPSLIWAQIERMQAEIAREVRVLLGEELYDERIFTDTERSRRVEALMKCAADSDQTPERRHEEWCKMHVDGGWVYGPEFKPAEKQHPNLKPWGELPESTRCKANIFAICAKYGAAIVATGGSTFADALDELTAEAQARGEYQP